MYSFVVLFSDLTFSGDKADRVTSLVTRNVTLKDSTSKFFYKGIDTKRFKSDALRIAVAASLLYRLLGVNEIPYQLVVDDTDEPQGLLSPETSFAPFFNEDEILLCVDSTELNSLFFTPSTARLLAISYLLEEDDLHPGNWGKISTPDIEGKEAVSLGRLDVDLSLVRFLSAANLLVMKSSSRELTSFPLSADVLSEFPFFVSLIGDDKIPTNWIMTSYLYEKFLVTPFKTLSLESKTAFIKGLEDGFRAFAALDLSVLRSALAFLFVVSKDKDSSKASLVTCLFEGLLTHLDGRIKETRTILSELLVLMKAHLPSPDDASTARSISTLSVDTPTGFGSPLSSFCTETPSPPVVPDISALSPGGAAITFMDSSSACAGAGVAPPRR